MATKLTKEEIYCNLDQTIINFFNERLSKYHIPIDVKFEFQANKKLTQLIKITKIPDQYSVIIGKDILVQVNMDYFDSLETEDESINMILFDQCIDLIVCDLDKGSIKIGKTNFQASQCIIEKYTYDQVQRAVEVERLYKEQNNDKK